MPTYTNQQHLGNNFLRALGDTMFVTSASITVYSGAQPTATDVANNWNSYKSSNAACLAHFVVGPAWSYNAGTLTWYNTSNTSTTLTYNTGTATWAIMWNGNSNLVGSGWPGISSVQISGGTIPSNYFQVVSVSNSTGTGIVRMVDVNIVPGTTATVTSSGMAFVFG